MAGLLVTGTSSDAGKSLVVTGLCRALARRGLRVAPFKSQNMSNNSMVCRDGSEIGPNSVIGAHVVLDCYQSIGTIPVGFSALIE